MRGLDGPSAPGPEVANPRSRVLPAPLPSEDTQVPYAFYKDSHVRMNARVTTYTVAFFEGTSKRVVEERLSRKAAKLLTEQLNSDREKENR